MERTTLGQAVATPLPSEAEVVAAGAEAEVASAHVTWKRSSGVHLGLGLRRRKAMQATSMYQGKDNQQSITSHVITFRGQDAVRPCSHSCLVLTVVVC